MKTYTTECVMVADGESPIYAKSRIIIRIDDQGAGPYLVVRGENSDPDDTGEEDGHEFFLQTVEEINALAATCKWMLAQAEVADKAA